jgi:ectoine hydroxylase-related dioxygenase (phytanoyl-CoA dioxygenase family)
MWVALHDATVANGTMNIVPRNFAAPLEHLRDGGSDHHITSRVDESQAIPIEMKAGGALFFNYGVPHCTSGNTTPNERAGLALHFAVADFLQPDDYHGGKTNDAKTILTGPKATGGKREFGVEVTGTWNAQVDRLLASVGT